MSTLCPGICDYNSCNNKNKIVKLSI